MERQRCLGERSDAPAETMAESRHCNIDSTTVRAHFSARAEKGEFINELLAARGAGPVNWPIAFHLTPGEAADCKTYDTLGPICPSRRQRPFSPIRLMTPTPSVAI
jgi:hypothetical protein